MKGLLCISKKNGVLALVIILIVLAAILMSNLTSGKTSTSTRASEVITPPAEAKVYMPENKINDRNPVRCAKNQYVISGLAINTDQECADIARTNALLNSSREIPTCGVGLTCIGVKRASNGTLYEYPQFAKVCKTSFYAKMTEDESDFSLCFYCAVNEIYPTLLYDETKTDVSIPGRFYQLKSRNKCFTSADLTTCLDSKQ